MSTRGVTGHRIAVVGTGYVGLVTAAGLADLGHEVVAVDIDRERVSRLRRGECPIPEPGLPHLLDRARREGRIGFRTDLPQLLDEVDAVFVAVATPSLPNGSADLRAVHDVARTVARHARHQTVVVVKSTVPVGTCDLLQEEVDRVTAERGLDRLVAVASNPEFLQESRAVADVRRPHRVVVGADRHRAARLLRRLYAPLVDTGVPLLEMDCRSAELTKYAANAMLATRISFMNQLSRLAEATGADIEQVRAGMAGDPRIGPAFLRAGIGFGGSCFPKDLAALRHSAAELGLRLPLVEATQEVNEDQQHLVVRRLAAMTELTGATVAVWGLTFKPDTDDLRDSPALTVVRDLLAAGARVVAHDPSGAAALPAEVRDRILLVDHPLTAATGADAVVHLTEWRTYRGVSPTVLAEAMRGQLVLDGRNTLDAAALAAAGLTVLQVGRSHVGTLTPAGLPR